MQNLVDKCCNILTLHLSFDFNSQQEGETILPTLGKPVENGEARNKRIHQIKRSVKEPKKLIDRRSAVVRSVILITSHKLTVLFQIFSRTGNTFSLFKLNL